jgi:hypothetical protein
MRSLLRRVSRFFDNAADDALVARVLARHAAVKDQTSPPVAMAPVPPVQPVSVVAVVPV